MKSKQVLITEVSYREGRPKDFDPSGAKVYVSLSCRTLKEAVELLELLRSDKIWVTNEEPKE